MPSTLQATKRGPLIAGLVLSVTLHAGLLLPMEGESRRVLRIEGSHVTAVTARFAARKEALPAPSVVVPRAGHVPNGKKAVRPHGAPPTASVPTGRQATEVLVQSAPANDPPSPLLSVQTLTEDDVDVVELTPEQVGTVPVSVGSQQPWKDMYSLTRRPFIHGALTVQVPPGITDTDLLHEPVVIAFWIDAHDTLSDIQALKGYGPMADAYVQALRQLRFSSGEILRQKVPSVMYLRFALRGR